VHPRALYLVWRTLRVGSSRLPLDAVILGGVSPIAASGGVVNDSVSQDPMMMVAMLSSRPGPGDKIA
jgi:hypothetical protein